MSILSKISLDVGGDVYSGCASMYQTGNTGSARDLIEAASFSTSVFDDRLEAMAYRS